MTDILQKLQSAVESESAEKELLQDALREIRELKQQRDALEEILIVLSRTRLPWDDEGDPAETLPHFKERYLNAIHEASRLLGLDVRSTITRTEPKT